jgi:antitoxin ParD1/3/4
VIAGSTQHERVRHVINLGGTLYTPRRCWPLLIMNITLTPELEQLVQTKVARGEYESADTFVREAVQLLIDEESKEDADCGEIRARIEAAETEIDRGEFIEYDETTLHQLGKGIRDRGLKRLAAERDDTGVRG